MSSSSAAPRTVLVTGGSRGIGAAVCRLAARDGYDVAVNYRSDEASAERVVGEVESFGRRAVALGADTTDPDAVAALFNACARELGPLGAVVNNAGIIHKASPLADMDVATIRKVIDADLTSAIVVAREAVRRMARSKGGQGGVIVNMSSLASKLAGAGGFIPYGAAKAGIDVLTEGLGKEVAGEGIRVAGLRPGLIVTDIHDDTGVEKRLERLGPSVPLGRAGTAEEVAEAVVWLLSDRASYVTATSFEVGGGR